jgi:protein TonB
MGAAQGPWQQAREQRARSLLQALIVSLLVHAALLLAFGDFDAPSRRIVFPPPLVARLVPSLAPPALLEAPAPREESGSVPPARLAPPPPANAARLHRRTQAAGTAAKEPDLARTTPSTEAAAAPVLRAWQPPAAPAPPAPAPAAASPAFAAAAPSAATAPAAKDALARASAAPSTQPDLGTLEEYQKAIRIVAARYKRYPRVAIDNNWEGSVVVRLAIGASGAISALAVRVSTGYEVLDREALDMVRQAAPQVPIPAALRGREFSAEIRVIFSLRDQAG